MAALDDPGPLTRKVLDYDATLRGIVPTAKQPADWAPLRPFLADDFQRIGCFLEVQDFAQYAEMLTMWTSMTATFETSVRQITEHAPLVYYEVEERHYFGDNVNVVNSLSVFEFDAAGKIRHLKVFLQQPMPGLPST